MFQTTNQKSISYHNVMLLTHWQINLCIYIYIPFWQEYDLMVTFQRMGFCFNTVKKLCSINHYKKKTKKNINPISNASWWTPSDFSNNYELEINVIIFNVYFCWIASPFVINQYMVNIPAKCFLCIITVFNQNVETLQISMVLYMHTYIHYIYIYIYTYIFKNMRLKIMSIMNNDNYIIGIFVFSESTQIRISTNHYQFPP